MEQKIPEIAAQKLAIQYHKVQREDAILKEMCDICAASMGFPSKVSLDLNKMVVIAPDKKE